VGLGSIPNSAKGIQEAENIASMVTSQLAANSFTWDWFNRMIGKDTSEKAKVLTGKEMLEEYKKHYFKQRRDNKNVDGSWYGDYRYIEPALTDLDKPLSLPLIRQIVDQTENNSATRVYLLNGLAAFLKYFGNTDYKEAIKDYKANNKPKPGKRDVPIDKRIIEVYKTGFIPAPKCPKKYFHGYPQWQFLYGLLATYGLRIHEAWNIANWDKPVTLKNGDWVTVDVNEDEEVSVQRDAGDMVIPAILDPNNEEYILCIKHATKTGYRMVMPLSPEGHNWIEEFNLLQPLNLPDMKNPLGRSGKDKTGYFWAKSTCDWFKRKKYGFKPHDLRHAYNHRGHFSDYKPVTLAHSMGHSLQMNSDNYLRHMSDTVKLQGMIESISKDKEKRDELEIIKSENKALKFQNQALENEIELLKTKLKMYEAIKESREQK
jgi:integrase